jgi:hypothetical protein
MTPALTLELRGGSSSSSWGTSTRMRTPSLQPQGNSGQKQMTTAAPVKTEPPAQIQATEDDTKEMLQAFLTRDSRNSFICKSKCFMSIEIEWNRTSAYHLRAVSQSVHFQVLCSFSLFI